MNLIPTKMKILNTTNKYQRNVLFINITMQILFLNHPYMQAKVALVLMRVLLTLMRQIRTQMNEYFL